MPKFYFDVFDGSRATIDDYGDHFVDVEDAAAQGISLLMDFVGEMLPGDGCKDFGVAIRNDGGRDVYRAALVFRDAYPDPDRQSTARDVCPAMSVPSPVDLIRQSRETRAQSVRVCERFRDAAAGLADMFRKTAETLSLSKAMRAGTG